MFAFNKTSVVALLALFVLAACASGSVKKDESGVVALGKMRVTLGPGWQRVTGDDVPERKDRSRVYSRGGLDSDQRLRPGLAALNRFFTFGCSTGDSHTDGLERPSYELRSLISSR